MTLLQFYDLNCPYCREAAADIDALVRSDEKLKLVFVPYAVLSVASVRGAMVEIAAAKQLTPEQYLDFHKRIYANRGTIDGAAGAGGMRDAGLASNSSPVSQPELLAKGYRDYQRYRLTLRTAGGAAITQERDRSARRQGRIGAADRSRARRDRADPAVPAGGASRQWTAAIRCETVAGRVEPASN